MIDPAQFPTEKEPLPSTLIDARGHKFIPVSLDDRHLGSAFKVSGRMVELVLGPWELKELLVAFPYMHFTDPKSVFENDNNTYKTAMDSMVELYYTLGGLPCYLKGDEKSSKRLQEISPVKAEAHSQALLMALAEGSSFSDATSEKVLTRFFTLRAGEDERGYKPRRDYATLDFVSPGAAKAAGKIILRKIHMDATWRNQHDASDIGLAFERAVLIFLSLGDEGWSKTGIRSCCRRLVGSDVAGGKRGSHHGSQEEDSGSVLLSLNGNSVEHKMLASPDVTTFELTVKQNGKGMQYVEQESVQPILKSKKPLVLPPDGYYNFDGMVGSDLGLQATLQKTHSVSGPEYIRQKQAYGLSDDDPFALVFIVPPERFRNGWTTIQHFHWNKETGNATTNRKMRRVARNRGIVSRNAESIGEAEKAKARSSIRQYVCPDPRN